MNWRRWWPNGQAWFWSPQWQAMEREADHALATGQYTDFDEDEMLLFIAQIREDIFHPGVICSHCGLQQRGSAEAEGEPLCHPNDNSYPDCYRLVTVYHEPLGMRKARGLSRDGALSDAMNADWWVEPPRDGEA